MPLLEELNGVLDGVEHDGRLVDDPAEACGSSASFPAAIMTSQRGTSSCSACAGHAEDLFDFALRRFASAAVLTSQPMQVRSAVLRTLPLNIDDGFSPTVATFPAAWNTRRATVASSLALFDEQGEQLFNADTCSGRYDHTCGSGCLA